MTEAPVAEHPKLENVLSRLEAVHRLGAGYRSRCPVHGGRTTDDLSIKLGQRWVLFYCFAGCQSKAILEKIGLTWNDVALDDAPVELRPRRTDARGMELEHLYCVMRLQNERGILDRLGAERAWAARALELLSVGWDGQRLTLPVRDKAGKLHDVLRYLPFKPAPIVTKGQGAWAELGKKPPRKILAGYGKSRLPWPAPEHVETDTLLLVEGEGTAISLMSVGIRSVALPGSLPKPSGDVQRPGSWQGAGWHRAWASRFTQFRYVVCFPDCDMQGRALMSAARYDLEKAGVTVRVVDLEPGSQDGRDIADILLTQATTLEARRAAKEIIRTIVAEKAEVLLAS